MVVGIKFGGRESLLRWFPGGNFSKFLRKLFLQKTSGRLLLNGAFCKKIFNEVLNTPLKPLMSYDLSGIYIKNIS